jgi:hypothetical protein
VRSSRVLVAEAGGETLALRAEPLGDLDAARLTDDWNEARSTEYGEIRRKCDKLVAGIEREFSNQKFTLAELEEEEAELEKLESWHRRIAERDIHDAPGSGDARDALAEARQALERYTSAVFERTQL